MPWPRDRRSQIMTTAVGGQQSHLFSTSYIYIYIYIYIKISWHSEAPTRHIKRIQMLSAFQILDKIQNPNHSYSHFAKWIQIPHLFSIFWTLLPCECWNTKSPISRQISPLFGCLVFKSLPYLCGQIDATIKKLEQQQVGKGWSDFWSGLFETPNPTSTWPFPTSSDTTAAVVRHLKN